MATPIRIKRSAVSGKRPQLTDLQVGELALNTYDGSLFTERDTGGVGIATTVSNLTPWTESYGASSISYLNSVGIGTTNPVAKLDVTGDSTFTGSMTVANGNIIGDDVTNISGINSVTATSFFGDGSGLTNTGAVLSAASGSQRLVLTSLTSGIMTTTATDAGLSFNATSNLLSAGNAQFDGNVSIGGTLTYEDVTNIDAVGLITAQSGIDVTGGSVRIGDNASYTANSNGDNLVIGSLSGNHGITIISNNTISNNAASLFFGDSGSPIAGAIRYFHASNYMMFRVAGGERLRITGTGHIGINSSSPTHELEVLGDSSLKGNLNVTGVSTFSNKIVVDTSSISEFKGNGRIKISGASQTTKLHLQRGSTSDVAMRFENNHGSIYAGLAAGFNNNQRFIIGLDADLSNDPILIANETKHVIVGSSTTGVTLSGATGDFKATGIATIGTGVTVLTNGNVSIGGTLELFNTTGNPNNHPSEIKLSTFSIGQHNNVGTMKIMNNNATGTLIIGAGGGGGYGGITLFNKNLNAKYLQANNEGSVDLYHDGDLRFGTTGYGVTVFGTTETQQLNVTGFTTLSTGTKFFQHTPRIEMQGNSTAQFQLTNATSGTTLNDGMVMGFSSSSKVGFINVNESAHGFILKTSGNATTAERINISGVGTVSIRKGTTEEMITARPDGAVELYHDNVKRLATTNSGVDITDNLNVSGVSTFNNQIFTNKISNSGIITSNMIHLTGGSFTAPAPGGDTRNDTAIVVNENFGIYALELQVGSGNNDKFLRRIIEKENNILTIGQDDTSLFAAINIRPGNTGTVSIGNSGAVSLVGVSEDGTTAEIEKLRTVGSGITVFGTTETQKLNVTGVSTFVGNAQFNGNIGIGTTNPQQELHIQNNVPIIRFTKQNGTTDNKDWNIGAGTPQILRIQAIRDDGGGGGQLFDFYRNAGDVEEFRGKSGAAYWFTINNDTRRVGIGTDNPQALLDVSSDSPNLRITDLNSLVGAGNTSYTQLANLNGNTYVYTRANENNGSYLIGGHGNGVFDEFIRITSAGNVGIGTANPLGTGALANNTATLAVGILTANTIYGNVVGGLSPTGDVFIGGNLDVDGQTDLDVLNVSDTATFTGNVSASNLIVSRDGNANISLVDTGHGFSASTIGISNGGRDLAITAPRDIRLKPSGGEDGIVIENGGAVELYHNNVKKAETSVGGLQITGTTDTDQLNVSGVSTFVGNAEFKGNVSIAGTLTYEDVTNIDSIGIITARKDIHVGAGVSAVGVGSFGSLVVGGGTTLQSSTTTGTGKALRIISPSGYIEVGAQNTSNAHFYTDRQRFYFNKKIVVDGGAIGSFNEDLVLVTDGSEERIRIKNDTGHVGINSTEPETMLDVVESSTSRNWTPTSGVTALFERNNGTLITLVSNNSSVVGIDFGDSNDNNAGFIHYDHSDNSMFFRTDTDEQLRITSTGNVGIGTDNPTEKLHLAADSAFQILLKRSGASPSEVIFGNEGNTARISNNTNGIDFRTGSTPSSSMLIDQNGKVGIGTDDPDELLELGGTDPVLKLHDVAGGSTHGLKVSHDGVNATINLESAGLLSIKQTNGNAAANGIAFNTGNVDTEKVRITGIGSVGIGTNDPDGQLHISSGAGANGDCRVYIEADANNTDEGSNPFIIFKNDGGYENASVWCGNAPDGEGANDNSLNLSAATDVNGGIRFFTSDTAGGWETAPERARITSDGELLINAVTERSYVDGAGYTQTPKLQVESNSNVDTAISLRYNSGGGADVRRASFIFARTADGTAVSNDSVLGEVLFMGEGNSTLEKAASIRAEVDGTPGTNDMPGRLIFSTSDDGSDSPTERLRITSTGNIGIGTIDPAYTLDFGKSSSSTIRLVSGNDKTAIRIGAGGNASDVTLIRVDGVTANHDGESDDSASGFSFKYVGSGAGVNNRFSICPDNQTGTQFEGVTVLQDGKVGIGTASPDAILHAIGEIKVDASDYARVLYARNDTNLWSVGLRDTDDFWFFRESGSGNAIFQHGNVGIGETTPTASLEIAATDKAGLRIVDSHINNNAPYIEVIGKRNGLNNSQSFGGQIFLAGNVGDAGVHTGKILGAVLFGGNHTDGSLSNIAYPASIAGVSGGSFDSVTDMPTDLIFRTGSTGRTPTTPNVASGDEKFRITSDGNLIHTSVNKTISLVSTQNAVNAGTKIAFFGANRYTTDQEFASIKGLLKNNSGGSGKQKGHLLFTVGSNSHQHIMDDDGNVGIGTDDPSSKLHVFGNANFTGGADFGGNVDIQGDLSVSGTLTYEDVTNIDSVGIITAQSGIHVVGTASSVGIGTSAPIVKLHVVGNSKFEGTGRFTNDVTISRPNTATLTVETSASSSYDALIKIRGARTGLTNDTSMLQFDNSTNTPYVMAQIAAQDPVADHGEKKGQLIFRTNSGSNLTEKMRIESGGNIGIITTNPNAKLHIGPLNGNTTHHLYLASGNNDYGIVIDTHDFGAANVPLRILTRSNNNDTERVRVLQSGNVGIGITNPADILTISGGGAADNVSLRIIDPTNADFGSHFSYFENDTDGTNLNEVVVGGVTDNVKNKVIRIARDTGDDVMFINTSKRVGIGSMSPKAKLDILDTGSQGILISSGSTQANDTNKAIRVRNGIGITADTFVVSHRGQVGINTSGVSGVNVGIGTITNSDVRLKVTHDGLNEVIQQWGGHQGPIAGHRFMELYSPENDANTDYFKFKTGNAIKFRIDSIDAIAMNSDGKVGIGTDNVQEKLHVRGNGNVTSFVEAVAGDAILDLSNTGDGNYSGINFTRQRSTGSVVGGSIWMPSVTANNSALLYLQTQSASAQAGQSGALSDNNGVRVKLASQPGGVAADSAFSVEVGASERLRITSTGQVKITGVDDQDNLVVNGGGSQFAVHQDDTDGEVSLRAQDGSGNNYTKYMTFFTENGSGPEERLRITEPGNVGIGITTPQAKLDVYGDIRVRDKIVSSQYSESFLDFDDDNSSTPFPTGTNNVTLASISGLSLVYDSNNNDNNGFMIAHGNVNTESSTPVMVIDEKDDVGIGTIHPEAKLEVNVGTAITAFDVKGSQGQLFSVTNSLSSGSIFSVNDISGSPSIDVDADGTIQLAPNLPSEKVGIGITNPSTKLHVNGGITATTYNGGTYAKYTGAAGDSANINTASSTLIDWMQTNTEVFSAPTNTTFTNTGTEVTIPTTGIYQVIFNGFIHGNGGGQRNNMTFRFRVNGSDVNTDVSLNNYIRGAGIHTTSSVNLNAILSLNASDTLGVASKRESTITASCVLRKDQCSLSLVHIGS